MAYPDPNQVNRTTLLRQIRDALYGAFGYANGDGTYTAAESGATPTSQGPYFTIFDADPTGAELPARPTYTSGVILTVAPGASITGFKFGTGGTPNGPPDNITKTFAVPSNATASTEFPINLGAGDSWFVTAKTGDIIGEWVQVQV